jgi:protein gp37
VGADTKIEWAHHTFNPWMGCTKVSPGCAHCYAVRQTARRGVKWGPDGVRVKTSASYWLKPITWNRRAEREQTRFRVFCASLADVFEENAQVSCWRGALFELIERTPFLDWLLLTKRPENISGMIATAIGRRRWNALPNVWLGTTVESQEYVDQRIPELLRNPAAVHFLSCEPLLGAVRLDHWLGAGEVEGIDWVIVGGESGPWARPCHSDWVESLVEQCRASDVAPFVKQLGANPAWPIVEHQIAVDDFEDGPAWVTLSDSKGGDWNEWPEALRVREFPR